jgi:hypothetical protein
MNFVFKAAFGTMGGLFLLTMAIASLLPQDDQFTKLCKYHDGTLLEWDVGGAADKALKADLKSPSTASIIRNGDDDTGIWYSKDPAKCEFTVNSKVDAQNGFGAMTRGSAIVRLKPTSYSNGKFQWDVLSVSVD